MKSKEEIEQLADKYSSLGMNAGLTHREYTLERIAYCRGYEQCQEDMADKKYTEEDIINLMGMATRWDTFKDGDVEYGMDMSEFFEYLINSLNKQD